MLSKVSFEAINVNGIVQSVADVCNGPNGKDFIRWSAIVTVILVSPLVGAKTYTMIKQAA